MPHVTLAAVLCSRLPWAFAGYNLATIESLAPGRVGYGLRRRVEGNIGQQSVRQLTCTDT
jgi:hypothetical protein